MNSLTYLSRQFDVLASAKTPPSTPTGERSSYIGSRKRSYTTSGDLHATSIPRAWSAKSFLFAPSSPRTPGPKRSYSSPADFITLSRVASLASTSSTSSDSSAKPVERSKCSADSLLDRIFFIRVLLLAWNSLRSAWTSLLGLAARRNPVETQVLVEEKDSSDEEGPLTSPPMLLQTRSHSEPDSVPTTTSFASRTNHTPNSSISRTSTPPLSVRKTPFHLPKTLVLDLDETLIHSTSRPIGAGGNSGIFGIGRRKQTAGHIVEVLLGERRTIYHVYKRPFVDFFLRTVCVVLLGSVDDPC